MTKWNGGVYPLLWLRKNVFGFYFRHFCSFWPNNTRFVLMVYERGEGDMDILQFIGVYVDHRQRGRVGKQRSRGVRHKEKQHHFHTKTMPLQTWCMWCDGSYLVS